jgi:phage terminase large subunit-like protein
MKPTCTLRKALEDKKLLGNILAGESWKPWRILLLAAMGEPLTADERIIFQQLTKRDPPTEPVEEFIGVVGRRGGKSRAVSVQATYLAGLCKYPQLVKGERGILLIIAPDTRQAQICLDYIESNFRASPILAQLIAQRTSDALELTNGITIEVRSSNFRRLRGMSLICCICDESAFFQSDDWSANPDTEIINAIRPGLATTNGQLFLISSPYARRG